jgi:hypothetical protein
MKTTRAFQYPNVPKLRHDRAQAKALACGISGAVIFTISICRFEGANRKC